MFILSIYIPYLLLENVKVQTVFLRVHEAEQILLELTENSSWLDNRKTESSDKLYM